MGFLSKIFGKEKKQDDIIKEIYESLFCDDFAIYKKMENIYPDIFSSNPDMGVLAKIATDNKIESRIRVLAYRKLTTLHIVPHNRDILGVIFEYHMPQGLDTLAVYADGSARYINYSGKLLFWEGVSPSYDVTNIFKEAEIIAAKIGPWKEKRLPPPPKGNIRLSFLVNGEIYFGQGPSDAMYNEPLLQNIIKHLTIFMNYLVDKAVEKN
ncbi:hypothetical protein Emin_0870 [Elusimicrobium minutum Pei191]|uniref:DUF3786 domain-containing protein n=1 Tax=Elusimicrobium minutum (strain Pei191) TaxID=445932 RepID=B2KD29_ELUMP|nr:hypothetical protein [Elusimicrobium minutum]ACC98425.1 hypothetical protein Emin_0870 [Elusimicrobium minutum Pei191]